MNRTTPSSRRPLVASALVFALAAPGCNSYLFEQKCPEQIKESQIVVPAAKPTPADILFVVDNSGSMADEQENLARNFEAFITQIAGAGDYQIMVVTTDTQSPDGEMGGLQVSTFATEPPHNLLDQSSSGCMPVGIAHGCARGPEPTTRIIRSTQTKEEQIRQFQENVRVGSCGSGAEQGLAGMMLALEETRVGGCNEGFLRDGANLVIVIVSDEEDADSTNVEQYVADLARFKEYSKIRVATIVGSVDGLGTNCRIPNTGTCGGLCQRMPAAGSGAACTVSNNSMPCPNGEYCQRVAQGNPIGRCENRQLQYWDSCFWCSFYAEEDCCSALGGTRYVDFARRIEQRVNIAVPSIPLSQCRGDETTPIGCLIDSICQESFSGTLERIARELVLTNKYILDPAPVYPEGVVVNLKGGRWGAGTRLVYGDDFSVTGTELTILGDKSPVEGEDIEIFYVTENKPAGQGTGACATPGS
ncbi:VWA domain-containing protein [Myxococcota bacterium]|nr:VWA domain-containing protein [Myxococcota bacterium]